MVDITTRVLGATAKGSPLTNEEIDTNFINLNAGFSGIVSEVGAITEDMIGFANRNQSTVEFNPATRVLTLAPVGASFDLYNNGTKVIVSTTKTLTISNVNGGRYIRYNAATGNLEELFDHPVFSSDILVAYISWDVANQKALVFGDERHGAARDTQWHKHQHANVGAIWHSGGSATYALNSATGLHLGLSTPITLIDEDLTHSITHSDTPTAHYEQILATAAQLPIIWKEGNNYTASVPNEYPWLPPTTGGCVKYNALTNGSGSLVDASVNKYVVYWIVLTNDTKYPVKSFVGNFQHNTLDDAYLEAFNPSVLSLPELAVMYQVVLATRSSVSNTFKATLAAVRRANVNVNYSNAVTPSDHSALSGRSAEGQHPIVAISGLQAALDTKLNSSAYTAGDVLDKLKTVDGQSSGLDAALLWGYTPATTNTADTIVRRDSSGNFSAHQITATLIGSASSAGYLNTARTITLNGDVSGSIAFDGQENVVINTTVADASHNHVISNVDGLQTALDSKAASDHVHTLNSTIVAQGLTDPNNDRIIFWDDSANTTTWLSTGTGLSIDNTTLSVQTGSTSKAGIVQLIDSISSISTTTAATPNSVRIAYELANAAIPIAQKASPNGIASLDATGKVPSTQLPSYVDDVLDYANLASFPDTGETGKIYVAVDTAKTYRWSGSAYVEISASPGSTDAVTEGSTNLYFTVARARSSLSSGTGISYNTSTGAITNTAPDQTVTLTQGANVAITGTYPNFTIAASDQYTGTVTSVSGTGTVNGLTLTGSVTSSGSLTLGGTLSNVSLTSQVSGILPVSAGGTGVAALSGVVIGNGTSAFTSKTNPSGDFVGTSDSQTLSNKTISYSSNTLTGVAPLASPTFTGTVTLPGTTSIGNVSSTELGYLDGVTSGVQEQLNTKASTTDLAAKAPLASPTFTGTVTTGTADLLGSVRGNVTAVAASNIDCSAGNFFTKTATGALSWTVSNVPATRAYSFIFKLTNGGTGTQTWFSGIKWPGGTAPTLTASGVDVLGFITDDGGTTWRGVQLMKDSK